MPATSDVQDAPQHPRPAAPGWWTETTDDAGAHFGYIGVDGQVVSLCGRRFRPLPHAITGVPTATPSPADETHGCPECRAQRGR